MMEKCKNQGKLLLFTARRYGPIVDDGKTSICCQFANIKVLERRLCYPCSDLCWTKVPRNYGVLLCLKYTWIEFLSLSEMEAPVLRLSIFICCSLMHWSRSLCDFLSSFSSISSFSLSNSYWKLEIGAQLTQVMSGVHDNGQIMLA